MDKNTSFALENRATPWNSTDSGSGPMVIAYHQFDIISILKKFLGRHLGCTKNNRTPYVLMGMMLCTFLLSAQESPQAVLEAHYRAMGGQHHISRVESLYSFANCEGPTGKYLTEIYSATGARTLFRQIHPTRPDFIGITNGNTYWTKGAVVDIADKKSAFIWRAHGIQWLTSHLGEMFQDIRVEGIEDFAGKACAVLSATNILDERLRLYFDKSTKLLYGLTFLNPLGEDPEKIQMTLNEWKRIGHILLPSKVTFTDKQGDFILDFHTIKINQIDLELFNVPEKIVATKKLMELHRQQRTAHIQGDAELLVSTIADEYIEVSNGMIKSPSREDLIDRFQGYFGSEAILEWDDTRPPELIFSDDHSMAYMVVNKKVRTVSKVGNEELTTIFAWTSIYKKIDNQWKLTAITSTIKK